MKVVILAGGLGTRLSELLGDCAGGEAALRLVHHLRAQGRDDRAVGGPVRGADGALLLGL